MAGKTLILGAADADATLIWNSTLSFAGGSRTLQVNDGAAATDARISGKLTGGGSSFTITGTGTLELTNTNNDYTNATVVSTGTLKLGANQVIPNGATFGNVTVDGTFDLSGFSETINGLSGANTGIIDNTAASTASTLTLGDNNATGTFSGVIQNSGSSAILHLQKIGTNSLTLGVANTYSGTTTVDGGALAVQHASALGTTAAGTVVNGTNTSNTANARLELSGNVTVTGEALTISGTGNFLGALSSSSGSNVWAGSVTIAASGTRLGAAAGASLEVSGVIDSGAVATGLVIRPNDLTGSVILSGANTYLGSTQVVIGKLQLDGGDNRLPVGTTVLMSSSGTSPDAEFDLNGRNQEVAGLALTGSGDASKNSVNNSSGTPSTLTVNTATPSTFAGILKGNLAITKTGPDTLSLSGTSNVHTGNTTVNQGILSLGGANTNNQSSTVTIAATGATLNLDFAGTDTVEKLFIGATQMPIGVYGPSATPLTQITGTGTLTVTSGPAGGGYDAWKGANAGGQGPELDFDNDGTPNGVEYFMNAAAGFTANPQLGPGNTITWPNGGNILASAYGTQFKVQTSTNLVNWNDVVEPNANLVNTNSSLSFTLTGAAPQFVRLVVTPE